MSVETKIGHKFLAILDSSFPVGNPLRKVLNRHTVQLSYRTMPNLGKIIAGHNAKVLDDNCRGGTKKCPMEGARCLDTCSVYQATVGCSGQGGGDVHWTLEAPLQISLRQPQEHLQTQPHEDENDSGRVHLEVAGRGGALQHQVGDQEVQALLDGESEDNAHGRHPQQTDRIFFILSPQGGSACLAHLTFDMFHFGTETVILLLL